MSTTNTVTGLHAGKARRLGQLLERRATVVTAWAERISHVLDGVVAAVGERRRGDRIGTVGALYFHFTATRKYGLGDVAAPRGAARSQHC